MKIALLGPSGAGKTVLLTGLYGELMHTLSEQPSYGITFELTNKKLQGYLEDRYRKLMEEDDFGEPSKAMAKYPFRLSTNVSTKEAKNIDIELVDFPGEALYKATEESEQKVEAIVTDLAACDGFIVLVDSDALIKSADKDNDRIIQSRLYAHAVKSILNKALDRRRLNVATGRTDPHEYPYSNGNTPVAFALTKGDKVEAWLASDPEAKGRKLETTVRKVFERVADPNHSYDPNEGPIANLIRSQFSQILDALDVVSARTAVTVYNQGSKTYDPKNVTELLQFVLFVGIQNATKEYQRRHKEWDDYDNERWRYKQAADQAKAAAEERLRQQQNANPIDALFNWLGGDGEAARRSRLEQAESYATYASSEWSSAYGSRNEVTQNLNVAKLFGQRILSDRLVYLLSSDVPRDAFYQKGLDIKALSSEGWWKDKLNAGKKLSKPANDQPQPGEP